MSSKRRSKDDNDDDDDDDDGDSSQHGQQRLDCKQSGVAPSHVIKKK